MTGHSAVYRELVRLRRGRALQSARLRTRVGPHLSSVCGVQETDPDRTIRQKVINEIRRLDADFPPDLRLALHAALAIDSRALHAQLEDREDWLASELHCSTRTARRRVVEASIRLAESLHQRARQSRPVDPESGWYLSRLSALLRLDTPAPELHEERTIVAAQDDLTEIHTRVSLPRAPGDRSPRHDLEAEALHGVRLRGVERLGDAHFRCVLDLPRGLRRDEALSYAMIYRIPPGQPMPAHYALVPLAPCQSFHVRVRFDPRHPPDAVWRLDRVAPRLLDEDQPGETLLSPDPAGDLSLDFTDLIQGYGYGIAWRPRDSGDGSPAGIAALAGS